MEIRNTAAVRQTVESPAQLLSGTGDSPIILQYASLLPEIGGQRHFGRRKYPSVIKITKILQGDTRHEHT